MIVRNATEADVPEIVRMARQFYVETSYAGFTPMDDDTVASMARWLIADGVLLVAEFEAEFGKALVGMVALAVAPFMFNRHVRTAHEVVWWVDPAAQGKGVGSALLGAVEPACKARGAVAVQMMHLSTSPAQAGAMYERAGYRHSETCYTKEVP